MHYIPSSAGLPLSLAKPDWRCQKRWLVVVKKQRGDAAAG
jgi:hypothetical protein